MIRIAVRKREDRDSYFVSIFERDEGGVKVRYKIEREVVPDGEEDSLLPRTLELCHFERDALRMLCDDLYLLGLRPSMASEQSGRVEAMKEHLHDLRRMVFNE